eukprot:UC4_evm3s355
MPPRKKRRTRETSESFNDIVPNPSSSSTQLVLPTALSKLGTIPESSGLCDLLAFHNAYPEALSDLGFELCGISRAFLNNHGGSTNDFLLLDRYPFDPPEDSKLHIGLWRDDPYMKHPSSCLVVCNDPGDPKSPSRVQIVGENFLSALAYLTSTTEAKLLNKLKSFAMSRGRPISNNVASLIKSRKRDMIAPTFSGMGIRVPYDEDSDVGWREISVTDKDLRRILDKIKGSKGRGEEPDWSELDRLVTLAQFANDEGDPGHAIQLGHNLFSHSLSFELDSFQMLSTAYRLLGRDVYAEIAQLHYDSETRSLLT